MKLQVLVQLIDEAVHGTGDKAESEVALQNVVITLLNQNQQLWQAFSAVSEQLSILKGEDWAGAVSNKVAELIEERSFLREKALLLLAGKKMDAHDRAELESYLHRT